MKILALETTGEICGFAVAKDGQLLSCVEVHTKFDLTVRIARLIETALGQAQVAATELNLIAVSIGPGSFTGTRIGMATAKGLAHALDLPILGVRALESIAFSIQAQHGALIVAAYPSRPSKPEEVYTAAFRRSGGGLVTVHAERAVKVEDLFAELRQQGEPVILCGILKEEDVARAKQFLSPPPSCPMTDDLFFERPPSVHHIVELAWHRWQQNPQGDDLFALKPLYVLPSQAEQRWGVRV